jgi:hypothetical protein
MGQIVLLDVVFSVDSIITAVGMTEHVPIMVIAVVVAVLTMLLAATPMSSLPSRMLDLSVPLDNETVLDPPVMRPKIEYKSNKENAWMLLESFPGLRAEDLPGGEGWAFELVQFTTHNGTHMDAPYHFQSKTIRGEAVEIAVASFQNMKSEVPTPMLFVNVTRSSALRFATSPLM